MEDGRLVVQPACAESPPSVARALQQVIGRVGPQIPQASAAARAVHLQRLDFGRQGRRIMVGHRW